MSYILLGDRMFRYKIIVFLFLLIGIFGFNFVEAQENTLSLLGHVIYVDAGHGGYSYTQVH